MQPPSMTSPRKLGRTLPVTSGLYQVTMTRLDDARVRLVKRFHALAVKDGKERQLRRVCVQLARIDDAMQVRGQRTEEEYYATAMLIREVAR